MNWTDLELNVQIQFTEQFTHAFNCTVCPDVHPDAAADQFCHVVEFLNRLVCGKSEKCKLLLFEQKCI